MSAADIFDTKDLFIGENRRKGITISVNTGTLDISSAYITIYNASDDSLVESTSVASVDNANVFKYIDTSSYSKGDKYALIEYKDGEHRGKARLNFEVL